MSGIYLPTKTINCLFPQHTKKKNKKQKQQGIWTGPYATPTQANERSPIRNEYAQNLCITFLALMLGL